jgi:predicted RNase H-like HicB family nuclease
MKKSNIVRERGKSYMEEYNYTIILEKEDDGGYHAFCPALPGCHTQGDNYDETMISIQDAIKLYIESLRAHHEPIPKEDITIKPLTVTV